MNTPRATGTIGQYQKAVQIHTLTGEQTDKYAYCIVLDNPIPFATEDHNSVIRRAIIPLTDNFYVAGQRVSANIELFTGKAELVHFARNIADLPIPPQINAFAYGVKKLDGPA